MGLQFQQTDGAGGSTAAGCSSGTSLPIQARSRVCDNVGATPGASQVQVVVNPAPQTDRRMIFFPSRALILPFTDWTGGEWLVRINVVAANANYDWTDTWICRADNALASFSTVGHIEAPTPVNCAATGVKSMRVEGQPSVGLDTDRFYIVCVFDVGGAGTQRLDFLPDQLIDTPLELPTEAAFFSKTGRWAQGGTQAGIVS